MKQVKRDIIFTYKEVKENCCVYRKSNLFNVIHTTGISQNKTTGPVIYIITVLQVGMFAVTLLTLKSEVIKQFQN